MPELHIPDMSCAHCQRAIERAVATLDPSAHVAFDMASRHATVKTEIEPTELIQALSAAGYAATLV